MNKHGIGSYQVLILEIFESDDAGAKPMLASFLDFIKVPVEIYKPLCTNFVHTNTFISSFSNNNLFYYSLLN